MRIQYSYPKLYQLLVHKLLYPKELWDKLRGEVGENQSVFDLTAGYGYASRFLHPSNTYYGIDLNKRFVAYGRKKGINLELKSIFDPAAYKSSDIIMVIDIIHHLPSDKLKELFNLVFQHAKQKVIVIDPAFVSIARKHGSLGKFLGWVFRLLDDDGITKIEKWLSEKEYQELFQSRFTSEYGKKFTVNSHRVAGYHFVVFTENI